MTTYIVYIYSLRVGDLFPNFLLKLSSSSLVPLVAYPLYSYYFGPVSSVTRYCTWSSPVLYSLCLG